MQCGFGIGFFLASLAWLFISPLGPDAWRVMFLLGVAPALLTLLIKPSVGTIAGRSLKYQAYKPLAAGTGEGQRSTSCLECKLPGGAMWTAAIKASLSSNFAA